ncbi:MAG: adenylosuccinate lyase, partial [Bacteroidetes bacterium]|nr:adenylosuccinate lyase [Bacteroidota bacterium]
MKLTHLNAISPIDGRYHSKTECLSPYFSEFGLMRYRVLVEVEYFISLSFQGLDEFPELSSAQIDALRNIYINFKEEDANWIKNSEKITNHDVKAVEYFLKNKLEALQLHDLSEFIHFGLTSQDINNTAIPLSIKEVINDVYLPLLDKIIRKLTELSIEWKDIPMLAKTHGQPASPTRLG